MTIDWANFSPSSALSGGLLIGLSAAALILTMGRIAGISGILGGFLSFRRDDVGWRIAFLGALIASPTVYRIVANLPDAKIEAGWRTLLIAGFLVGIGTRYGAGCTSGHGVCGVARLSPRSMAAVATFMAAGILTVFATRHLIGATS
jgi:uncharacterized membrane protein YedE/YeeE